MSNELEQQLRRAFSLFDTDELKESQRLLHGRGRCYPGFEQLSIDWFAPVLLLTRYKEEAGQDLELLIEMLLKVFREGFPQHALEGLLFQDRSQGKSEARLVYGSCPDQLFAREQALRFVIEPLAYQNIGFFLDARAVRDYLARYCSGKRVLNLFSFTCSYSVVAIKAGANSVVNLDMGKGVLERGKRNHELNGLDGREATFIKSDVFKAWKKLHKYGRYDVIVIDPPSFQKGSFNAEKDYARVIRQLGKLLAPDARIIACVNSPFLQEDFLDGLFLEGYLNQGEHHCRKLERLPNPKAFVDVDQQAALKVVVYAYSRLGQSLT